MSSLLRPSRTLGDLTTREDEDEQAAVPRSRSARIATEDLCVEDSPEEWLRRFGRTLRSWHEDDDFGGSPSSVELEPFKRSKTTKMHESFEASIKERLCRAEVARDLESLDWTRLETVEASELLDDPAEEAAQEEPSGSVRVDINSGGQVFFALLRGSESTEVAVVLKFCTPRHVLQAEQLAAELAWHLGVGAPTSRVLLRARDEDEWQQLETAVRGIAVPCTSLVDALQFYETMMVLQFVPGKDFKSERNAWDPGHLARSARSVGSLLILDVLLDNRDRLEIADLSWRGNASNVLWASDKGDGDEEEIHEIRCVPIDACIAFAPAGILEDSNQAAARLLELAFLDRACCYEVLSEIVSCNPHAAGNLESDWEACGRGARPGPLPGGCALKAFHEGMKSSLGSVQKVQGLLEMVASVVSSWLDNFRADPVLARLIPDLPEGCTWAELRSVICRAARSCADVKARLSFWQELIQDKALALLQAVEDFAEKQSLKAPFSFRGFLGPTALSPLTDARELVDRLEQLLLRTRVLTDAALATRPADLSPSPLLVGPAMSACCLHYLRKVGVTCIINCTKDLPEPSEEALAGIAWHRVALADTEDQDLSDAFAEGLAIVDACAAAGGRVLVHCHEGKSRSISLCLAYFVTREKRSLKDAIRFVKSKRREASPNAGFLRQLLRLEEATLGTTSLTEADLPRGKPKALVCPICGEAAGLTRESLARHMAAKHEGEESLGCAGCPAGMAGYRQGG